MRSITALRRFRSYLPDWLSRSQSFRNCLVCWTSLSGLARFALADFFEVIKESLDRTPWLTGQLTPLPHGSNRGGVRGPDSEGNPTFGNDSGEKQPHCIRDVEPAGGQYLSRLLLQIRRNPGPYLSGHVFFGGGGHGNLTFCSYIDGVYVTPASELKPRPSAALAEQSSRSSPLPHCPS